MKMKQLEKFLYGSFLLLTILHCYVEASTCYNDGHCGVNLICNKKSRNNELKCDYGNCECKSGYYGVNSTYCKASRGFNDDCDNNDPCHIGQNLQCKSSKCVCADKYKREGDKCILIKLVKLGGSCEDKDATCEEKTQCENNKCICDNNLYVESDGKCVKAKENQNCTTFSQCEGDLSCENYKCNCLKDGKAMTIFSPRHDQNIVICTYFSTSTKAERSAKGENYQCGYFDSKLNEAKNIYYVTKCPKDLKCTDCEGADGRNSYVCRGGAKSLMSSVVLTITLLLMMLI